MNLLPYLLFGAIFFPEYLVDDLHILPKYFKYIPEILSAATIVILVLRMAYTKVFVMSPKYIFLVMFFSIHVVFGIILNNVQEGTVIWGVRIYFKYAPFFLLHAIYQYSDKQVSFQLKILLVLAFMQVPIAFYQRFVKFGGVATGDVITGTLTISSFLSMFLISVITIIMAFYLTKRVSGKFALVTSLILFMPTTINETKGTVILLPLALFVVLIYLAKSREMRRKIITVMSVCVVSASLFFTMYDMLYNRAADKGGIVNFFTNPDQIIPYLYSGIDIDPQLMKPRNDQLAASVATDYSLKFQRRLDRIIAPIVLLSSDPLKLFFGLGIGNVSPSYQAGFVGAYAHLHNIVGARSTLISYLVWEVGIVGAVLFILFLIMIFKDAFNIGRLNGIQGSIAAGWTGVVVIMILSLPYKNVLDSTALCYLFWYFSGYVAAKRVLAGRVTTENLNNTYMRLAKHTNKKI